jgi:hypothetical protein
MIVGDDILAPGLGDLRGVAIFGDTREQTEREARAYLGRSELEN